MLDITGVTRFYGDTCAVNQVSFSIGTGEIVGLLGHNGAGKTTIMKMISGYLEPDSGSISLDGLSLAEHEQAVQAKLGYLPENLPVYPEMTVGAYLDYAADLKGLKGNDKVQAIREAVSATDLLTKVTAPISTLSRGFRQRVGVAQAILGSPKLLILDEPTNGLDPSQTELMRKLIRSIAENATVILSTHIMQEVEALCDRVLIIDRGELRIDESLASLQQSSSLQVECSLNAFELEAVAGDIPGFQSVESIDANQSASLRVSFAPAAGASAGASASEQQYRSFTSELTKQIIQAGGEIYRIAPETKDLEALFKQASASGSQLTAEDAQGAQARSNHAA